MSSEQKSSSAETAPAPDPTEHDQPELQEPENGPLASDTRLDHDQPLNAVAGVLASKAVRELARPLRHLRENLAVILDAVERHVSHSEGPDPYPWKALQSLRQDLAEAYLLSRDTARIADELSEVMGPGATASEVQPVDVNRHVEAALALVRSRFRDHTELFIDLGSVPPVRAVPSELSLIVAKLLLCVADSAAGVAGSAVSVQTRYFDDDDEPPAVMIAVADNGVGTPAAAASARASIEPIMARLGGSFDGVSEPGQGSAFECWFPVGAPAPARS